MKRILPFSFIITVIFIGCNADPQQSISNTTTDNSNFEDYYIDALSRLKNSDFSENDCVRIVANAQNDDWPAGSFSFLKKALENLPNSDWLQFYTCRYHLRKMDVEQALTAFNLISKDSFNNLDFILLEIDVMTARGLHNNAIDKINAALIDFPSLPILHDLRVQHFENTGHGINFLHALHETTSLGVNSLVAHLKLLEYYFDLGNTGLFDSLYEVTSVRFPKHDFRALLAKSLILHTKYDSAKYLLHQLMHDNPSSNIALSLSNVFLKVGPLDSAIFYSDLYTIYGGEKINSLIIKARAYDQLGAFEKAYGYYKEIQEIDESFQFDNGEIEKVERKVSYLRQIKGQY